MTSNAVFRQRSSRASVFKMRHVWLLLVSLLYRENFSLGFTVERTQLHNRLSFLSSGRTNREGFPSILASKQADVDSDTIVASEIGNTASPLVQRTYETFLWDNPQCLKSGPHKINYRVEGPADGPPILLIHGFGANVNHFRYQFPALVEEGFRVYAVDLLGFGASDKPADENYSIELFADLLSDFVTEKSKEIKSKISKWVVAGNSIGGLCSLAVTQKIPENVRGIVLFNCAGGMSGFRYEDVPAYVRPILWLVQNVFLGPQFGGRFFKNFKSPENVCSILTQQGVYRNLTKVDDELLEILLKPGDDEGATEVFLKTFGGPPGPTPESILPEITCPILTLWGDADPWTPLDKGMHPGINFPLYVNPECSFELVALKNVGHCPHDDAPEQVHAAMIPWLKDLPPA